MKIIILGGGGMLGHKLLQVLGEEFDVWCTLHSEFNKYEQFSIFKRNRIIENVNIERKENYSDIIRHLKPDVIINAIGIIKQLPDSKDVVKTLTINSIFPYQLSEIARDIGARFITFSTDCVFDGRKGDYKETDPSDAYDIYGKSKWLGEISAENCLTLRTSIIGRELFTRKSLVEWFMSNRGGKIKGYTNAIYSGFPTIVISKIVKNLISNYRNLHGLYHISSEPISKFDLLKIIREKYKIDVEIEPFADFHIDRSLNSDKFRFETGFSPLSWEEMIEQMADDSDIYERKI